MTANDTFRANVTRLMAEQHVTLLAITEAVGKKSTGWASMFVSGRRDVPVKTAEKIAAFLGVPLWRLLIDETEVDVKLLPKRKQLLTPSNLVQFDPTERKLLEYFRRIQAQDRRELAVALIKPLAAASAKDVPGATQRTTPVTTGVRANRRHGLRKDGFAHGE